MTQTGNGDLKSLGGRSEEKWGHFTVEEPAHSPPADRSKECRFTALLPAGDGLEC